LERAPTHICARATSWELGAYTNGTPPPPVDALIGNVSKSFVIGG
jgi:hypothetical protein